MALLGRTRNSPIGGSGFNGGGGTIGGGGASGTSGARPVSGNFTANNIQQGNTAWGNTSKLSTATNRGGYLVIIPASGFVQFPAAIVPNDATVRIRAHNGTSAGNTNPVGLVDSYEQAIAAQAAADFVNPDDEVIYPTDNLSRVWVRGTPGDGAIASIRSGGPI